jgi:putative spermidine/putrescine transport system substrate-binding protein
MRFLNYLSIVAAAALSVNVASAASDELVFVSWGGSYQDAIREAWLKPFSKETGVNILEETGPDTAKVKAMVDSGSVTWDIITDGEAGVLQGARAGLIEEITSEMVNQDHVYPQMRNPYGVPSEVFSTVYGFSTEAFPDGGLQPSSWADFFDVEKFPGKRALRARPGTILEAALMADGVPNDQVHEILGLQKD